MDRVGLLQLAPIIFVRTALREVIRVVAIELRELLECVVAVMKLVAGNRFKKPAPNNFVALFLARWPPRGFNSAECLLKSCQGLLTSLATHLNLRCWQRG